MTLCEIVAVSTVYAILVILCGVATFVMVRDELEQINKDNTDE